MTDCLPVSSTKTVSLVIGGKLTTARVRRNNTGANSCANASPISAFSPTTTVGRRE